MKITYSISNWIYGNEPLEEAFKRLKKYDYDAIELMVEDPATFDLQQVKSFVKKYELPICSICTMMTGAAEKEKRRNLIDQDESVQDQTVKYLKDCISIGEELGASLILTVPSGVANVTDGWTKENKALMVKKLGELGDHARSSGKILLAIEPINRYENAFMQRGEQALEILDELKHPQVKMMLDFFHTNIEESNNGDAIRLASSELIHCHIADSNRKSVFRGHTDWFEIVRALRDIDFVGSVACEPLPPTSADVYESRDSIRPEADLYAKECIEHLKQIESSI